MEGIKRSCEAVERVMESALVVPALRSIESFQQATSSARLACYIASEFKRDKPCFFK